MQIETINQEKNVAASKSQMFEKRAVELEAKLGDMIEQVKEVFFLVILFLPIYFKLHDHNTLAEQQFKNEMSSQKKLTDLYQSKSDQFGIQNEELQHLVRELEQRVIDLDLAHKESETLLQEQLEESIQKYQQQQERIQQLEVELDAINRDPAQFLASNQVLS